MVAFVTFSKPNDAEFALYNLKGSIKLGRKIFVSLFPITEEEKKWKEFEKEKVTHNDKDFKKKKSPPPKKEKMSLRYLAPRNPSHIQVKQSKLDNLKPKPHRLNQLQNRSEDKQNLQPKRNDQQDQPNQPKQNTRQKIYKVKDQSTSEKPMFEIIVRIIDTNEVTKRMTLTEDGLKKLNDFLEK